MSALLVQVNPKLEDPIETTPVRELTEKYAWAFPSQDFHSMVSSLYRRAASNIYKTRDGQYLHLHGRSLLMHCMKAHPLMSNYSKLQSGPVNSRP